MLESSPPLMVLKRFRINCSTGEGCFPCRRAFLTLLPSPSPSSLSFIPFSSLLLSPSFLKYNWIDTHITNQALKAVELFTFKVELFEITDLLVNVTKHVLRPRHQVLNDDEKESLLKKYSLDEKQLPRLSSKDPIVRYYGLETGQVMKITYKDELSDSQVTYGCVGQSRLVYIFSSLCV